MGQEYPNKTSFAWVSRIRKFHFTIILLTLFGSYLGVNIFFAIIHYLFKTLKSGTGFFDYIYFSFITSFTIGYGDFYPIALQGKIIVIVQSCITAIYFALMISILSIKMLYPGETIKFSKNIIYNSKSEILVFRIINTNREILINPEVRISVTEHQLGNIIANTYCIPFESKINYLGKHDFSYSFNNKYPAFKVMDQVTSANEYNKKTDTLESRFRINISITGTYGLQQIAIFKKYYASDIVVGMGFKPITYSEEDQRKKGEIRYYKFNNFWTDFNSISENFK